jgi:hypothetical protein
MRNLLVYRFLLANALGIALAMALAWTGHLTPVFEHDESHLTVAIAGLFVIGWLWSLKEVLSVSGSLNSSKLLGYRPATAAQADKALLKVEWLEAVSEWLVGLGLLGTVIGFSIALSGIDQTTVKDAAGAQNAVATLMVGMRIALNTTLLGAALALWHEVNMRMLRTAMGCYWIDRTRAHSGEIASRWQD